MAYLYAVVCLTILNYEIVVFVPIAYHLDIIKHCLQLELYVFTCPMATGRPLVIYMLIDNL